MKYLDEEEIITIRERLATGPLAGQDFGAVKALRPNGLASAVARQTTGLGSAFKYTDVLDVAATLFYGMALNHPFENGNKRTALVVLLVFLQRNRILLVGANEDELYEMSTQVAGHTFQGGTPETHDVDEEVVKISAWLKTRTRALERGDRSLKFKEFKSQLEGLGCEFEKPKNNFIKVRRSVGGATYTAKLGYPRPDFNVGVADVKRVRANLRLDESHGYDSGAFYEDDLEAVVDKFVNEHRLVLERLALT